MVQTKNKYACNNLFFTATDYLVWIKSVFVWGLCLPFIKLLIIFTYQHNNSLNLAFK